MQRLARGTLSRVLQGLTTVLVLALWAAPAPAASAQDDEGWTFRFAPYIWGVAMDGDATIGGTTTEISSSFADIIEKLNFGLMGNFGAQKGPWSIGVDGLGVEPESLPNSSKQTSPTAARCGLPPHEWSRRVRIEQVQRHDMIVE